MRNSVRTLSLSAAAVATLPVLLLTTSSAAFADGELAFGGGAGDRASSAFEPTAGNCEGLLGYLRSHGGNVRQMSNTFQNEWRQCAAGSISFGKG